MRSLESAPDRVWTAWRSPGRFTKNPDLVALPSGRLLAVYADTDKHWAEGLIRLTLIQSASPKPLRKRLPKSGKAVENVLGHFGGD